MLVWFFPSHFHVIFLGAAVVVSALTWEVLGGVTMAAVTGVATAFGLWRIGGTEFLTDPILLAGYGWAGVATLALGYFLGSLTRQTRQMSRVNENLRQAQQQLSALHQIALSLSTTLDGKRLMEIILEQLGKLWGYDYGAVLLVDESTGHLVLSAAHGYKAEVGLRLDADQGISGAVLKTGAPVCVGDVTQDKRYVSGIDDARSELAIPLVWEGKILGVLNVESREPDAYTEADVALLTTVAEQAAAYLVNARLHQKTRLMAITDAHTGLYNYRYYVDQVAALVRQAQLTDHRFALLMLDLDHFKRCNDTYGHPTGDRILAQTADVLRSSCRQEDMVFRYGGEEFAVILPDADKVVAGHVAERIRERISSHSFVTKQGRTLDFCLTVSIGVASYPEDGLSDVDLILAADQALYTAKQGGRNRIILHGGEEISPQLKKEHPLC